MQIEWGNNKHTDRVNSLTLEADTFVDERIVGSLLQAFRSGSLVSIQESDGEMGFTLKFSEEKTP